MFSNNHFVGTYLEVYVVADDASRGDDGGAGGVAEGGAEVAAAAVVVVVVVASSCGSRDSCLGRNRSSSCPDWIAKIMAHSYFNNSWGP